MKGKGKRRVFLLGLFSLISLVFAFAYVRLCEPPDVKFSQELSPEDQKQIAGAVRRHSVANALVAVESGRFGFASERFKGLPRSVIYAQGTQSDGRIWIHVGVPDTKAEGGRWPVVPLGQARA
jgi:hypothetical protein